ncbi:MAG: sn-glycerol-3-phosphate ABC transporter ATP-binding protein UgpC [Planctomycetota bacterium]
MATVTLESVSKVYDGNVRAVDRINVEIGDGEFVVLVGPSGCGKSTTLRMIAGLEEISEGEIRIGDRVVNDVPPRDRDIAMVFQNYALYPHMTVYKNMGFGLKLRKFKKSEIDRRVKDAAASLGITHLLERKPKALSGGQRQRVAVGRAIVRDPECFLFDEPLSNLDAKLRVETRAELKTLHQRLQTTTVYVTHDQEEAMTLGDRVVVMSEGLIQQAAGPLEVYGRPANRFVAAFVGMPPMNFLEGRLIDDAGRRVFEGQGLRFVLDGPVAEAAAPRVGQDVTIGLRPETLELDSTAGEHDAMTVQMSVDVVEPLGSQMDIHGHAGEGIKFVARCTAQRLEPGVDVRLRVKPDGVHLFEPGEYGARLRVPGEPEPTSAAPQMASVGV